MKEMQLTAEVTGLVVKISASPGSIVAADETLLVLESMKMEIPMTAPVAGWVKEFLVTEGDTVEEGQVLALFIFAP